MSLSLDAISSKPTQLCGQDVVILLQYAAGTSAQVSLFEIDQQNWPWITGKMSIANSQHIELALGIDNKPVIESQEGKMLIAKLYYDEHIYQFKTQLTFGSTGSTPNMAIQMSSPEVVDVCERRRIPRRSLRRQSKVQIGFSTETTQSVAGVMLNVSSAGLACRLSIVDSSSLNVDTQVRVNFSLDDSDNEFRLAGHVVNKSEAGSPGQCIVGIEFDDPADAALKAKIDREINGEQLA